jgi:hypothetical protein
VTKTLPETFSQVVSNRTTFRAAFTNGAKLTFRQQLEFKNVKIFELGFQQIGRQDPYVRSQAQFRYDSLQKQISIREGDVKNLLTQVSNVNPQFGAQLKKSSKFLK